MPSVKKRPTNQLDAARKVVADAHRERAEIGDVIKRLDMLRRAMDQIQEEVKQLSANLHLMYGSRGGQPNLDDQDVIKSFLTKPNDDLDKDIPF